MVHTFIKRINLKLNVIALIQFEIAKYDVSTLPIGQQGRPFRKPGKTVSRLQLTIVDRKLMTKGKTYMGVTARWSKRQNTFQTQELSLLIHLKFTLNGRREVQNSVV